MEKLLSLQQKIVPEIIPLLLSRYQILRSIRYLQPVGRRALADKLQLQERKIRNEVDVLKEHELVSYSPAGMQVTPDGDALLWDLEEYIREIQGLKILEDQIAALYQVKQVIMVPADSAETINTHFYCHLTFLQFIYNCGDTFNVVNQSRPTLQ